MVPLKRIISYFFFFLFLLFLFNIPKAGTIDGISLKYNKNDLYEEKYHKVSFYDLNIYELEEVFKNLNIRIINVKPVDYKEIEYKSYADTIDSYKKLLINENFSEIPLNSNLRGFNVESMLILCTTKELIELESRAKIL